MAYCTLPGFLRGRDSAVFPKLMCRIFSPPGQGLANYHPHTECILPLVSVNSLLGCSHARSLYCLHLVLHSAAELQVGSRDLETQRLTGTTESIYYLALSRKCLPVPPLRNSWNWCSLGTLIGWVVLALVCDESAYFFSYCAAMFLCSCCKLFPVSTICPLSKMEARTPCITVLSLPALHQSPRRYPVSSLKSSQICLT